MAVKPRFRQAIKLREAGPWQRGQVGCAPHPQAPLQGCGFGEASRGPRTTGWGCTGRAQACPTFSRVGTSLIRGENVFFGCGFPKLHHLGQAMPSVAVYTAFL